MIHRIGLCNVNVSQIRAAQQIAPIASVQVSMSVLDDDNLRNGVAEYCRDQGIQLLAYRPLGGIEKVSSLSRDPVLKELATRLQVTPQEIALAWLCDLRVVPLPGCTRNQTAQSLARVVAIKLSDDDRAALDARFSGRLLRVPRSARRPKRGALGDVVLVMGMPGAGKSVLAQELVAQGYERLNRDERGGSLSGLISALAAGLSAGHKRWVLDNTYPTRQSRNEVIECAWQHGVPVRCVHLTTSTGDAQINAITRLVELHGSLPTPEELREIGKMDPRYFGPDAQFRYERSLELPDEDEGFEALERRTFVRRAPEGSSRRAAFLEYDDVVVTNSRGAGPALRAEDIAITSGVRELLQQLRHSGWLLFAQAWRPQVARGEIAADVVDKSFARTRELLAVDIEFSYCPHDAGPPICWCRKPLPGRIIEFAFPRSVSFARSVLVGRSAADSTLAQRLGVSYTTDLRSVIITA
jgi:histidinol phosphatase-like enzyme